MAIVAHSPQVGVESTQGYCARGGTVKHPRAVADLPKGLGLGKPLRCMSLCFVAATPNVFAAACAARASVLRRVARPSSQSGAASNDGRTHTNTDAQAHIHNEKQQTHEAAHVWYTLIALLRAYSSHCLQPHQQRSCYRGLLRSTRCTRLYICSVFRMCRRGHPRRHTPSGIGRRRCFTLASCQSSRSLWC